MLKPQPTPTRDLLNLDGLWAFATDDQAGPDPWLSRLGLGLESAVPASYNDLFADPAIRDHVGWAWYQRTVQVPRGWGGRRIVLRLDAATYSPAASTSTTSWSPNTWAGTHRSKPT